MKIDPLNKSKKKNFLEELAFLGKLRTSALFIKTGKERVRAYTGSLSIEEIWDFWRIFPVEGIGLYLGKEMINKSGVREVRLSTDGLHLFKDQIQSNILVLNPELEEKWFLGEDLELSEGMATDIVKGFVAVKSESSGDLIGVGKLNFDKNALQNFLPKERRRKERLA
jgi:NOL1/NOP2/fmu family ribosome biogenesis protein